MGKTLNRRNRMLIGFTLFSMFFGAGNLIFPPLVGLQAGSNAVSATIGLLVSAVGFPILGVAAVARSGGLDRLAGRVHPMFASVFTLLIYLMIGPGLAIPRTASTSFEMAAAPFAAVMENGTYTAVQAVYSVLFFGVAFYFALRPDKLKDRLGKIMTPILLILIAVVFIGCLVSGNQGVAVPIEKYQTGSMVKGFIDGYQTMDTIAALNFGIVIAMNIKGMGIQDDRDVSAETIKAGGIAGILLVAVYGCLAYVGAITGGFGVEASNGADVLTFIVHHLFGKAGSVLIALIFFIACLNVCIGLLSCCSEYFSLTFPKLSYRVWLGIFAGASLLVSNAGLDAIIKVSSPALSMIYPVAIVLIILSFLPGRLGENKWLYRVVIGITTAYSVVTVLISLFA